jgi:hypothetical protein
MYLLAAVRTENPLGILLFDDPLQNMDELTVTTVARGLAKVVNVFPADWQLVFLFHGEDDLERFRQEIPAAVYLLPWLAPAATASDEVTVGSESLKSTFRSTRRTWIMSSCGATNTPTCHSDVVGDASPLAVVISRSAVTPRVHDAHETPSDQVEKCQWSTHSQVSVNERSSIGAAHERRAE